MSDLDISTHQLQREALDALVSLQQLIDNYTPEHERRVAELAIRIGRELDLGGERLEALNMAALVHDIGKVDVPLAVLNKPGRLTDEEFALIRGHAQTSYDILNRISFSLPIPEIAYAHHEYLDGSGYPRALKGDQIMLESRILTVADIVESMAQDRPYRASLGIDAAINEIKRLRGTRLDPKVVDACLRVCAN